MASAEFIAAFNELLTDPANLNELHTRLNRLRGVGAPVDGGEHRTQVKTIEDKHFRRIEVYAGVIGT